MQCFGVLFISISGDVPVVKGAVSRLLDTKPLLSKTSFFHFYSKHIDKGDLNLFQQKKLSRINTSGNHITLLNNLSYGLTITYN